MRCERCQKNEAVVHITEVRDGHAAQLNLCGACSELRDAETDPNDIRSAGWTSYGPPEVPFDE